MQVPMQISIKQYSEACRAFCEAVGLDPGQTLFPMTLTADAIYFSVVVPTETGGKSLAFKPEGVGNLTSILAATGKIEVEG